MTQLPQIEPIRIKLGFKHIYKLLIFSVLFAFLLAFLAGGAMLSVELIEQSRQSQHSYLEIKEQATEAELAILVSELKNTFAVDENTVKLVSSDEGLEFLSKQMNIAKEDLALFGQNILPRLVRFAFTTDGLGQAESVITTWEDHPAVRTVYSNTATLEKLDYIGHRPLIIALVCIIFFIFALRYFVRGRVILLLFVFEDLVAQAQKQKLPSKYLVRPFVSKVLTNFVLFSALIIVSALIGLSQWTDISVNVWGIGLMAAVLSIFVVILLLYFTIRGTIQKFYFTEQKDWRKRII